MKKEKSGVIIQHQYFKPEKTKKLKKFKNILLFGLYIAAVVVIVNFASGNKTKAAYGDDSSERIVELDDSFLEDKKLSSVDRLKIKFLENYIGSKHIARSAYKYSLANELEPELMVAIMKIESNFKVKAVNYNKNGSIDRGLCQLNSFVFSDMRLKDFFNPDMNIERGAMHIKWCLDQSGNNLIKGLAMYNAGYGSVSKTRVGDRTLDYIHKIINEMEKIKTEFKVFSDEYQDILK
ncbi:MAG TPA: lytic transglycosylase domain-containing protein [Spirochaetota bacterium]|nr:lytic transglycosylase domain-containing protein [Spirochaetota bacterium]HOS32324.1 lytic transglycosylase domain-containing protein [Spirochaetota bacterium]HOS54421.1 lytic transglycosylase domain-containing protein [Spirochaetota bacterium]HPK62872.1 lytic transglycosylase domain-containing protein [Spirochaetota bacterium]HQF76914.1 lytic transglycosylase domain-containing protein [Spirochaetota bacterium]